jgi:hypothetical protein
MTYAITLSTILQEKAHWMEDHHQSPTKVRLSADVADAIVESMKGLWSATTVRSSGIVEMGRSIGLDWYRDETLPLNRIEFE